MLPASSASSPGTPAVLAFACGACGTGLEVPVALAGVTGPCPVCGSQISAPAWPPAISTPVAGKPSELLTRPPRVRELPPPEPRVGTTAVPLATPAAAVRPLPAPPLEENTVAAPPAWSAPVPASPPLKAPVPVPAPQPAPAAAAARPASAKKPLGLFQAKTVNHEDANEVVHRKPPAFRRRGLMRWVDVGIVGLFTGLSIACLAAMRYTVPIRDQSLPGLPPNLTELVEKESRDLKMRQREAEKLATDSVGRFLGCNTKSATVGDVSMVTSAAASHLLPPPEGMTMPALPAFEGLSVESLAVESSRRIPGSDDDFFIITLKPPQAPGPVFVVEQTDRGPLLHSGVITQQTAGLFEKFINEPGTGSDVTLYGEVRPAERSTENKFRAQNPNFVSYQLLELRPLGKAEAQPVCLPVNGAAAAAFARRSHDTGWRRCIASLRWAKDAGGADVVEVARFHPGTWSGDLPPRTSQTAMTNGPAR